MTEAEKAYQYFVIAVPENEEQAKAYFYARKALQSTLTPPNEWVSVEERLPDELTMVLIYSGGIYDVAGWIEDEDGKICWTHNAKPQFWRPIPGLEPPGKDNNVPTKEQNEPLTPCDVCMYNPPSSMGGKPCYICPASPPERQEDA